MTIENTQSIDFISLNEKQGIVHLFITDHLDWNMGEAKLKILQDKINFYLSFIESGEMTLSYPNAVTLNPVISLVSQYEVTKEEKDFLLKVTAIIEDAGYSFEWKHFDLQAKEIDPQSLNQFIHPIDQEQ